MRFSDLNTIDWDLLKSTEDWIMCFDDLRGLISDANSIDFRDQLADAFDNFADHSTSDNISLIAKLDASARKTARALRIESISERIEALKSASDDYQAAVDLFQGVTKNMRKEAALLRAEKFTAAASSLTDTVNALKNLSKVISNKDGKQLAVAISQALASTSKLRDLLKKSV